ncbi:MAG: ABC transporter ATP-binding protein, partial [Salinibacterium sp.]|nr:ABC transporter ATP-binding protein [Salinibacterium sp.]
MTTLSRTESASIGGVPVLEVEDLRVTYRRRGSTPIKAVDGVDLRIMPGTTLGLVGESGSGKSTLGRAVLGLAPIAGGAIRVNGRDVTAASRSQRRVLSQELQVIFQDPYGSLNPTKTIGATLAEPMTIHRSGDKVAISARVDEVLREVGMPADAAQRYPNAFSGGQRQRIAIARAL